MKRVAYVMVNHNGGEEVFESAKSVLADLTDSDLLILVDNGSTDGSGEKTASQLSRIVYLHHDENLPFAEATNVGIRHALEQGVDIIGPINPDVRILPGMTETLNLGLKSGKKAVSPVMMYEQPANTIWYAGGKIHWLLGWMSHVGNRRSIDRAHHYGGTTEYLTGCCWLAPREVWQKVGLLDDSYGMYAEDADWSTRAKRAGVELVVLPTAMLIHRLSQSSGGGRSTFKLHYRTMATRLFFKRFTPASIKMLQKPVAWFVQQAYSLFLLMRHGSEAMNVYRRACTIPLQERIPWPPSRPIDEN